MCGPISIIRSYIAAAFEICSGGPAMLTITQVTNHVNVDRAGNGLMLCAWAAVAAVDLLDLTAPI